MATALTAIFGNELKVVAQPRVAQRQYAGFPGAHGVAAMHMGSRGFAIIVSGKLRQTSGANYAAKRATLETTVVAIEQYLWLGAADYTYGNVTYYNVVFENFLLQPVGQGKYYYQNSEGQVVCDFVCRGRGLI